MTRHFEDVRASYKPDPIRVLFVGESRPASDHFFYIPDESKGLRHYTEEAFRRVFGNRVGTQAAFLTFFKSCHCYLDDLCRTPIDNMKPLSARRAKREGAVESFAARLKELGPGAIVVTMKGISKEVERARVLATMQGVPILVARSPSHGGAGEYVRRMARFLRLLRNRGLLPADSGVQ